MNVLITGVQYRCQDVAAELERMLTDHVKLMLLRTTAADYGVVIEVRERYMGETHTRGMVSRVDLPAVLQLMEFAGKGVLLCDVVKVSAVGGYFYVKVREPEGFRVEQREANDVWKDWSLRSCPMLDLTDDMVRAEEAYTLLKVGLTDPGLFDEAYIVENLEQLISATRYDVSREAQEALAWCMHRVGDYPSFVVQDYQEHLVHAINGLGSRKRIEEFDGEYLDRLYDSEQACVMLNMWYVSLGVRLRDEEEVRRRMIDMLDGITGDMLALPEGLGSDTDDFGQLMHRMVYRNVSRRHLLMVLSAVVMRIHIADALEEVIDGSEPLFEVVEERLDGDARKCAVVANPEAAVSNPTTSVANSTIAVVNPTDALVEKLRPIFWGVESEAHSFIDKIRGMKNRQVTDLVRSLVRKNIISEMSCKRPLWTILHDAGLYGANESNWNNMLRK